MSYRAEVQSSNITPPKRFIAGTNSGVWVQTVDSTARPYNIGLLPLGGRAALNAGQTDHVYITLLAETNDVFYYFGSATSNDLSDTATNAAGVALTATTMTTPMCMRAPVGVPVSVRIEKSTDTWIVLKTAAAGATLRVYASSHPEV